jgi:hypothetical protein
MANKTRLYRVQSTGQTRLIEATNQAAARSYVARKEYSVDIPAQHEIYAMARDGIQIELATEELSDTSRSAIAQADLAT